MYVASAILGLMLVGAGLFVWRYFFDYYHYAEVDKGVLYRDGFITPRQFEMAVGASRAQMVISLLTDDEYSKQPYKQQVDLILHSKLRWHITQVPLGGYPTTEQVREVLDGITKTNHKPVLIHCAQGIRRTGMLVAAYQMSVMHWDKQKTKDAILAFGHSDRTINDIKRFIDVYDPETRTVTQVLGKTTVKEEE